VTPIALPMLMVATLALAAVAGPWLIRRAAPAFVRVPRVAVALLGASLVLWVLALAALGPLLAWLTTGPMLLPTGAGEVCQRCLDAASPFGGLAPLHTGVPTVFLLVLPALGLLALALTAGRWARLQRQRARRTCRALMTGAHHTRIAGHVVTLVPDERPVVFALPRRRCGIVISTAAMDLLDDAELAAVLAHEDAHLRQRHHLIATLITSLARPLRLIPLAAAITDAVPHYLEIAADDAARSRVSTPALASALLKLGEPAIQAPVAEVLHAAGPSRVGHLVGATTGRLGLPAATLLGAMAVALAVLGALIYLPYLAALATGCL